MCRQVLIRVPVILFFFILLSGESNAQYFPQLPDSLNRALKTIPEKDRDSLLFFKGQAYYAQHTTEGYRLATECYLGALQLATELKHTESIYQCQFGLGTVYEVSGNIPKAIEYYKLYYNEIFTRNVPLIGQIRAAYNLAVAYRKINDVAHTYKYAMIMDSLGKKQESEQNKANVNLLIADLMWYTGNKNEFVHFFKLIPGNMVFHDGQLPLQRMYASASSNYLILQGKDNESLQPLLEELKTTKDSSASLHLIFDNLYAAKRYKEACYFQELINKHTEISSQKVFTEMQYRLLNAENAQKDKNEKLLQSNLQQLRQRNRLMYLAAILLIIGITSIYFVNRKFNAKNKQLHVQNEKIVQQKEDIHLLVKEMHHRVKNNLQIICSLIDLQQIKSLQSKENSMEEIQAKIKTIALAHELAYEGEQIQGIPLNTYLQQMVENSIQTLTTSGNKPQCSFNIAEVNIEISKLVPIALMVNELLFNTIKYALPGNDDCRIQLSCTTENKTTRLCYMDNGPGLPDGFDVHKAKTMGMRLIRGFARQIDADISVTNIKGQSLKFCFTWPDVSL